jgi:GT2 family glycosyltransferase
MLLSFVVPAYNEEAYLGACLESILDQTRGLEAIGGYDTSITFYGEDTDIARRLHGIGKVLFTFDLKMLSSASSPQA